MLVAVAGAGIAGLTTAIALVRHGIEAEILERATRLEEIGAGIQLSPNAMTVLDRLGATEGLGEALTEPRAIEIRSARKGALLARIPLGDTARQRYGAPYCLIHRADLQAGLLRRARDLQIPIHMGCGVTEVIDAGGAVSFRAGAIERSANLLVGADGLRSEVRTRVLGHPGPASLDRTAWRTALPSSEVPPGIAGDVTGLWLGRGAHLVHYPVRGGERLNIVVIGPEASAAHPRAARFGPPLQGLLAAAPGWTAWPLLLNDPRPGWTRGRVALVGDAAHAFAPSAAQGGAQAIEDGWALAAALAANPTDPPRAVERYERGRRRRVARVAREAGRNLRLYELEGLPATLRNLAIRTLPGQLHLRRLDWLYGARPD